MNDIPEPHWYSTFGPTERHRVGTCPLKIVSIYNYSPLRVGDVVRMPWVNNYQHSATMIIQKINKKSIKCQEVKGSYGSGRIWNIHKSYDQLQIATEYTSDERLLELANSSIN